MKKTALTATAAFVLLICGPVFACGIDGMVTNSDGSKVDGTSTISTSWNSKTAFPRKGRYSLDLGSSVCGKSVTVYLDGGQGKRVKVTGATTVNFVRR